MDGMHETASAHGRFQPIHNGHLEYIFEAKRRCRFLYVGITQHITSRLLEVSGSAPHRSDPLANPLTYYERQAMIREVLLEAGLPRAEFAIVPFPVEDIAVLPEFLPLGIPILTTIYEEWNRAKIALLEAAGYQVEVLYSDRPRRYSGSEIRKLLLAGDDAYEEMIPSAALRWIEAVDLRRRLLATAGR